MPHNDLGLLQELRALAVLLEERHVSRAAVRFHLSQSSMSRTLQRLRTRFGDELLVRSGADYALTPRAREIQRELTLLLPRLENLVGGHGFDPATATGVLRLIGTDYTTSTLGPYLLPALFRAAPGLEIRIEPRDQDSYADLDRGRADLAFSVLRPASPLRWERLFTDDVVCVVDRDHPVGDRFTLDGYLAIRHVVITLVDGEQPMIERWLQRLGRHRTAAVRVAYFHAALAALPGTTLVATVPRRLATLQAAADPRLRLAEAPEDFDAIPYGMIWHARLDADPVHTWLRDMVRAAVREMPA
ncbi:MULTISPECIES: LysR family transcriptional regulator [Catenuloplanes]|uniref:DNA-binding transcriptional LysR family regulator n=1 Tax=Catenuloplanes niger TaxID=587534 RepID=A0AAE3ZWF9_9ACTN|nr:LysR family transcriptional regulator [Catenuloplanes niger]MDR7327031.1 DNA-binding transcriptional LysR family regulator [Catenuloplanes niger]